MSKILEELYKRGKYLYVPRGNDMEPMLKENKSIVEVVTFTGDLKPNDVAMYCKNDEIFMVNRIVKVKQTDYVFCGDNSKTYEYIPKDRVVGVVTRFYKNGEWTSVDDKDYLKYVSILLYKRSINLIKEKVKEVLVG